MKKMRILHVGNHTLPCEGGIERVLWQGATEQAKHGHAVSVMVFNTCTNGLLNAPAHEEKNGVFIHRVPQRGPAYYRMPRVSTYLAALREADIVHVHGLGAWADLACVLKPLHRAKIVVTTHGGYGHTSSRSGLKKIYRHLLHPFVRGGVDHFFLVSPEDYSFIAPLPEKKYSIVPNGIEFEALEKIALVKKDPARFLYVGRISKNKRVDHLLDAFSFVVKKMPKAKLVIVGEDWEGLRAGLEEKTRALGITKNVSFLGKISDTQRMSELSRAGIIVSASQYEGFGISILEGMAAGCVPCVNDIPSFRTFVHGNGGMVTDFSHAENAGKALLACAQKKTTPFRAAQTAARKFASQFSIHEIESAHLRVYATLLER